MTRADRLLQARAEFLAARRANLLRGVPVPEHVARAWRRYGATLEHYGGWPGVLRAQGVAVPEGAPYRMSAEQVRELLG